jgi:hypothetical protein
MRITTILNQTLKFKSFTCKKAQINQSGTAMQLGKKNFFSNISTLFF